MKENLANYTQNIKEFWQQRSKVEKRVMIGSLILIILLTIAFIWISKPRNFVPLYNNLSLQEVGQIKDELDQRGISYRLEDQGTTITVPKEHVNSLLVELAAENIPETGRIDYSFFGDHASWGITDHEFNMIKLDAMNNELEDLIQTIEGVDEANVMITLPEESVFLSDEEKTASASIVIHTNRGFQFEEKQIESLYHLVSKAVPNLPKENIVIRNQYLEYFDDYLSHGSQEQKFTYQQTIKNDIERDIQRRLQQMLGAMVGGDRVIVSVTADIDFTEENRIEELVEPVDLENLEGIPVSIETIHETYSGDPGDEGIVGTGEEDPPNYTSPGDSDGGEYELVKETINNEFNHIRREISESPFTVRDLGIQVAVDNVVDNDRGEIQYLSQQEQASVEESIHSILHSMISSSISEDYNEENIDNKISIVFQEFSGIDPITPQSPVFAIPTWMYIVLAILLFIIIILTVLYFRNRRVVSEEIEEELIDQEIETPGLDPIPESDNRLEQIEQMAKENPEDFAKLLRSWLADD